MWNIRLISFLWWYVSFNITHIKWSYLIDLLFKHHTWTTSIISYIMPSVWHAITVKEASYLFCAYAPSWHMVKAGFFYLKKYSVWIVRLITWRIFWLLDNHSKLNNSLMYIYGLIIIQGIPQALQHIVIPRHVHIILRIQENHRTD